MNVETGVGIALLILGVAPILSANFGVAAGVFPPLIAGLVFLAIGLLKR